MRNSYKNLVREAAEKNHLEDLWLDGRTVLTQILKNKVGLYEVF
jgi:hypothetical protein